MIDECNNYNQTISCPAMAAKEHIAGYFQQITELLKGYLTQDQDSETSSLQVQSLGKRTALQENLFVIFEFL